VTDSWYFPLRTWHGPSVEDPNNDDYLERFNELV